MKMRNVYMMRYAAMAIALLIGLTGCGSSVARTNTTGKDKDMLVTDIAGSAEPMMAKADTMPTPEASGKDGTMMVDDETMPASGEMAGDTDTMARDMMAVTYEKNFSLMDLDGNTVTLNDFEGKKIYVKFWATWCSICLSGIEELETFSAEQNAGTEVSVITIISPGVNGEFSSGEFKTWYEKKGYTFPVLFDEGGKVLQDFRIRAFPTSMIFEKDGTLSTNRLGHIENDALRELLGVTQ